MQDQWTGGPEIHYWGDPNGVTLAQIEYDDHTGPVRWVAYDLTGETVKRIGEPFTDLNVAKRAVEAHFPIARGQVTIAQV